MRQKKPSKSPPYKLQSRITASFFGLFADDNYKTFSKQEIETCGVYCLMLTINATLCYRICQRSRVSCAKHPPVSAQSTSRNHISAISHQKLSWNDIGCLLNTCLFNSYLISSVSFIRYFDITISLIPHTNICSKISFINHC